MLTGRPTRDCVSSRAESAFRMNGRQEIERRKVKTKTTEQVERRRKAHQLALETLARESVKSDAKAELAKIFGGKIPVGVFINGDPRGHMLKLDNDGRAIPEGMQTDWGGNGILAVEINPED